MKLITRDTDYAMRALCYIDRQKKRVVSVRDLSRELDIPRPFLRKLLQRLTRERIVSSYKGRQGGFTLAIPAQKVCLADLIEIFQGNTRLNECLLKDKPCPRISRCPLSAALGAIERDVVAKLKALTIASLAASFSSIGSSGGKR